MWWCVCGGVNSISLWFYSGITLSKCHFITTLHRSQSGFISDSLQFHFDTTKIFSSVVIQLHVVIISTSCLVHFELTWVSTSLSEFSPVSPHFDSTSNSLSVSLRFRFDVVAMSLRFHFEPIAIPLRIHLGFISSLRTSLRIYFELTSTQLRVGMLRGHA